MAQTLPPVSERVLTVMNEMKARGKVRSALEQAVREADRAMEEQVALCEIPAPTFSEQARAEAVAQRMRSYGLTDVAIDEIGNVVGKRPGRGGGPILALGAHMDSVFPAGTDVRVKREGNRYRAPGIGDNCSGLRALLQVLRMMNDARLETEGDVWFIGTVGEEGNGDIRGSKYVTRHYPIDGFIAIDSTDVGRVLRGAVGSHRWRLAVDGPAGHSYADFGKVPSAIHAVCLAGARVAHLSVPAEPKTTFTIGRISGGTSVNTIAGHCEVEVDMRSVDNDALMKLEAQVLQAFEEAVAEENAVWGVTDAAKCVRLTKTPIGNRPAGRRPDDCPVLQCARAAQQVLGIETTNYGFSSTDANAPMSEGIPATCLCSGGRGVGAHTLNEYFDMVDTHLGPQLVFLTAAALVGVEGARALLPVRRK